MIEQILKNHPIYRVHPYIKKSNTDTNAPTKTDKKTPTQKKVALIIGTMPPPRFCEYSENEKSHEKQPKKTEKHVQTNDKERTIWFSDPWNQKDIDFYYGSFRNQFWRLMFDALKEVLKEEEQIDELPFSKGTSAFLKGEQEDNPFKARKDVNELKEDIQVFLDFCRIGITDIVYKCNNKTYMESQLAEKTEFHEITEWLDSADSNIIINIDKNPEWYNDIAGTIDGDEGDEYEKNLFLLFTSTNAREWTLEKLTKEIKKEDGDLEVIDKETWELSNKDKSKRTIEIITLQSPSKEKMSASDNDIVMSDDNYNNIGEILRKNRLLFTSDKARKRTLEKLTKEIKKEDGDLEVIDKETWELSNKDKSKRRIDIITLPSPSNRYNKESPDKKLKKYIDAIKKIRKK